MTGDPAALTASEALTRLRTGALSVEALAKACLDRIAIRDGDVMAWSYLDADRVIARARALDSQGPQGPLFGLPVGVKDVILTKDMPTTYNSPIYKDLRPGLDAACVATLRTAGALIFGKTETVEFAATGRTARTRNPHNTAHTPGGSSSGSGAAVADNHVPLALGTQTGGSIMRPASYCGVYAVKPTWNLVSSEGAKRFAPSLDTVGWFARSAADLGLLYDVLDPEPAPTPAFQLKGARIAFYGTPIWEEAERATRDAVAAAIDMLANAGAIVEDLKVPDSFNGLPDTHMLMMRAEGRNAFLAEYRADRDGLSPQIQEYVDNPWGYSREDLRRAYDHAAQCRADFDRIAGAYDAVLAPSSSGVAPEGLHATGGFAFAGLWTMLHTPVVNVPGFTGDKGLPVGLTVTGPRFSDRKVLAAAGAFGQVFAQT